MLNTRTVVGRRVLPVGYVRELNETNFPVLGRRSVGCLSLKLSPADHTINATVESAVYSRKFLFLNWEYRSSINNQLSRI